MHESAGVLTSPVIAGLDPAIHVDNHSALRSLFGVLDPRIKSGGDSGESIAIERTTQDPKHDACQCAYSRTMSKAKTRAPFAALLLLLTAAVPQSAEAAEPYPIWWSPKLELDSLDAIDARLARPFWDPSEYAGGLPLYPAEYRQEDMREARNCVELLALRERGYFARSTNDINLMWHFDVWCRAIAAFKTAEPATQSFLRGFSLDRSSVNYLPALVVPSPGCDWLCRQQEANVRRIPLAKFDTKFEITTADGLRIVMESPISRNSVEIVGRADFTQDGLDDLLVIGEAINTEPAPTTLLDSIGLYILTRDTADKVLAVMNADRHFCSDYVCTPPYDEPPALREFD